MLVTWPSPITSGAFTMPFQAYLSLNESSVVTLLRGFLTTTVTRE